MSELSHPYRRMGFWSATSVATIGVVYGIVGLIGAVARPPGRDPLHQVDPYLAILEILMILSTVALVVMMAAVYAYAPPDRKTHGLAALACIIVFAVLTCSVHFASLTVGRQIDSKVLPLLSQQLSFAQWPTLALALDLLAWDFFLGLAMLFAASVFKSDGLPNRVRVSLIIGGTFCLVGTLGPALGHMRIQYLGIAGYAFVLPVACVLLAMLLRRTASL
jgi:hypothetical protein